MMKNIFSVTALAAMASASTTYVSMESYGDYTVAELEEMEQMGTPIRLAVNPPNDFTHYFGIKLGENEPKWTAQVDESLPTFQLSPREILDSFKMTKGWNYWYVHSH